MRIKKIDGVVGSGRQRHLIKEACDEAVKGNKVLFVTDNLTAREIIEMGTEYLNYINKDSIYLGNVYLNNGLNPKDISLIIIDEPLKYPFDFSLFKNDVKIITSSQLPYHYGKVCRGLIISEWQ